MKKNYILYLSLFSGVFAAMLPRSAAADMVNYGALQSLFGEPVTTSATGTPQLASDVPANMTIITADEIRQSGSRSIPEILSRVPGLDILQGSSTGFDVGVRGYQQASQPRLLVLIDGRQVFIDDYSRTIWDSLPVNIDDIRQIEVVKGASSALFGSNAAGGVINIITYSPLYDHDNVASVDVGTQATKEGDTTVTDHGSWGGTKFSAGEMYGHEFNTARVAGSDLTPTLDPRHGYFANSSVFKINSDLQINTEANFSEGDDNELNGISHNTAGQEDMAWSLGAGANWQSSYGLITFNNYLNHSFDHFMYEPSSTVGLTTNLLVSQLQDEFKIGTANTFRAALEYRYKDFTGFGEAAVPQSPKLAENNYAASGTWLWQIKNDLSWTNALRVEQQSLDEIGTLAPDLVNEAPAYSRANNVWSANSAFVYKATDVDTLRLGYGRGVQLPSMLESGFNLVGASGVDSEGNPYLKPTISQDVGLDYDRKISSLSSILRVSPFYEDVRDVAVYQFSAPQDILGTFYPVYSTQNVGDSHGLGGELQFKGNKDGFRWDASYSYSRVDDSAAVVNTVDYQGSAPENHFRLLLGYSTGAWEFDTSGQYVTGTDMLHSTNAGTTSVATPVNGYASLGGRIGYKIDDRFTVSLSGTNISDAITQESPYPAIERQAFLALTGHF